MSETIRIAGLSIRVDKMATISPEQLLKLALKTPKYHGVKGAEEEIKGILKDHGIFKRVPTATEVEVQPIEDSTASKPKHTKKSKRNRRPSKN